MANGFSLSGRTALVTGGARGIGWAIAEALGEAGARVCVADLVELASTDLPPGCGLAVRGDVSDERDAGRMVESAVAGLGPLDILVNNAGILIEREVAETSVAEFDRLFAVNVRGTFLITRAALPHMRRGEGPARIVNISSELAPLGRAGASAYAGTKGAVIALTRSWARELAPDILVNAVAPGPTDTELLGFERMTPALRALELGNPLGRIARPEEISGAVVWLAGAQATFVTGQTIGVTGGAAMF